VPVLDYRGLLDRLRQEATWAGPIARFSFGPLELDFSGLRASPLHILTVPQLQLEKVLEARFTDLGGTVRRGHDVADPGLKVGAAETVEDGRDHRAQASAAGVMLLP
jgi:hypothetical protein